MFEKIAPNVGREPLDVLGIGFGPSNLAVAIAAREMSVPSRCLFLEKQPAFAWHAGMMLPQAKMQVSFLKDLATFRNPCSEFTFVNYLKTQGRLSSFANLASLFPYREEYQDYLRWCARKVADDVQYDTTVTNVAYDVDLESDSGRLLVTAQTERGEVRFSTRNVVCATGLRPRFPAGVKEGLRVRHGHDSLVGPRSIRFPSGSHVAVIGAGQSAAEIVACLQENSNVEKLTCVISKFGFVPSDNSPFVNEMFSNENIDLFYRGGQSLTRAVLRVHSTANYGAAEEELIREIYSRNYSETISGRKRLSVEILSYLRSANESSDSVTLDIESPAQRTRKQIKVDYAICATGFDYSGITDMLTPDLRARLKFDLNGEPILTRSYRISSKTNENFGIYDPGAAEGSHGISATLLSNMAVRAGEILEDVLTRKAVRAVRAGAEQFQNGFARLS